MIDMALGSMLAQSAPWYQQTLPALGLIAVALVASYFLGNALARAARSRDHHGWRFALIFSVLSVAGLVIVALWPPRFGVDLRGGITIIGQLREDADESSGIDIADMIPRLIRRVDPSGTKEIMIRPLGTDKIEVTIPDVEMDEAMRIWERLTRAGHLLFRIVADERYHPQLVARADRLIKAGVRDLVVREEVETDPTDNRSGPIIGRWYELARVDPEEAVGGVQPFKFMPMNTHLVRNAETKQSIDIGQFGQDGLALARWAAENEVRRVEVLAVEPSDPDDKSNVEGEHIDRASAGVDDSGGPAVLFSMTRDGRARMGYLTSRNKKVGDRARKLAIISDSQLLTAPDIESTITSSGIIRGRFTEKEVSDIVINLNAGRLEVALAENPISQDFVESTIGNDLRRKGIFAIGFSLVVVMAFMIVYYRFAGVVACLALMANLVLVLAAILMIKQPLTMTGLAGLVLTIGMAVDANVLVFERIREELGKGAALRMAVRNGFDRALVTIVDANLTTLLTALVLYVIGSEQLKGFAVTLSLGILTSMFTAVFCSRAIIEIAERLKWITTLNMLSWFPRRTIDFIGARKAFYLVSGSLIVIGLVGVVLRGKTILDHDLRGGSTARVVLADAQGMSLDEFRKQVASYQGDVEGEKVEFSVSAIKSDDYPNRVFKVDSNIPVWEEEGEPPYKEIDDVLAEVFTDKIMRLHVDFDPQAMVVRRLDEAEQSPPATDGAEGAAATDQAPATESRLGEPGDEKSVQPPAVSAPPATPPADSGPPNGSSSLAPEPGLRGLDVEKPRERISPSLAGTLLRSAMMWLPVAALPWQEPAPASGAPQDQPAESAGDAPQEPPSGDPAMNAPQDSPPAPADQEPAAPAAAQEPAGEGQDQPPPAAQEPETPPAAQEPAATPPETPAEKLGHFEATVPLTFAQAVTRRSVIDAILAAAEEITDITLEEADVVVSSPDIPATALLAKSKSWILALKTSRDADALRVLQTLQAGYNGQPYFPTKSGVGGQIASQTQWQALAAMMASLLIIIGYIWVRFQNVAFGLAAVVALVHDVLITLGAIALSFWLQSALGFLQVENFRVSLPVIAAFLTLIGYSLNDTIVVFDRIREVRGKRSELTAEMLNVSLSQTLSRTILTSGTTLLVLVVLYFMGGEAIHPFAFALLVGIVTGTYSSIAVASPILLWLMNRNRPAAGKP